MRNFLHGAFIRGRISLRGGSFSALMNESMPLPHKSGSAPSLPLPPTLWFLIMGCLLPDLGFSEHQSHQLNNATPAQEWLRQLALCFLWLHFHQPSSVCDSKYFWGLPHRSDSYSLVTSASLLCSTSLFGIGSSSCYSLNDLIISSIWLFIASKDLHI